MHGVKKRDQFEDKNGFEIWNRKTHGKSGRCDFNAVTGKVGSIYNIIMRMEYTCIHVLFLMQKF